MPLKDMGAKCHLVQRGRGAAPRILLAAGALGAGQIS
jgi:hypothetical protein